MIYNIDLKKDSVYDDTLHAHFVNIKKKLNKGDIINIKHLGCFVVLKREGQNIITKNKNGHIITIKNLSTSKRMTKKEYRHYKRYAQ